MDQYSVHPDEIAAHFTLQKPASDRNCITFVVFKTPCHVFKGEALQNKGRTSEKLNSGGFEDKEDKNKKGEGNGDLQAIAEEPEKFLDNPNKNTPKGTNQGGMGPQNTKKLNMKAKTYYIK